MGLNTQICLHPEMDVLRQLSPFIFDIFKRLADISLEENPKASLQSQAARIFMIQTSGDLEMLITMKADKAVYASITEHMARKIEIDEDDIKDYVGEFFNILCGRMISAVNREYKTSIHFGIPRMNKQKEFTGQSDSDNSIISFYYECRYGTIVIQFELV